MNKKEILQKLKDEKLFHLSRRNNNPNHEEKLYHSGVVEGILIAIKLMK